MKKRKHPANINKLAASIVDLATNDQSEEPTDKNPHAVALGKLGGKKGGKARAEKLSEERRKEIASEAARARWRKTSKK